MVQEINRKKICIAIHGLARAGAERIAAMWANYLANQGNEVFVMVYASSEDTYNLDSRVRMVPIADSRDAYCKMAKTKQLLQMRKIIRTEQPDVIISFLPKMQIMVMLATIGMRIKRIETVRNNPWIDRDVVGKRFLWNLCFRRSDAIIVQTYEQAIYFPQRLQKKIVVVSNTVSGDFLNRQKVYSSEEIRKFVAVARVNPQKNYPMMIRAFAKIVQMNPAYTLDIYGTGMPESMQEMQILIDELGMNENIRLCGWQRNLSEVLTAYDAFLMSSEYEGMPNALAEAMVIGLICLSTDCKTGPRDMIDSGINGFLATTGDEDSFAEGIRAITQMSVQQRIAMGKAAREKILRICSEENTLVRLKQLIDSDM